MSQEDQILYLPNNSEVEDLIDKAVSYKRNKMYDRANDIYDEASKEYGDSGLLFVAMAKNYACQEYYDKAISLLKRAKISAESEKINASKEVKEYLETAIFNIEYHINNLETLPRESTSFYDYIKSISGDPTYVFPSEIKKINLSVQEK